jgi:hypothetical protein
MKLSLSSFLCAVALFVVCAPSAIASEATCRQPDNFILRVIPVHGEVKYDFTKTFREIQQSAGPVIAAKHHPLLGMSLQGFGLVSIVQTSSVQRSDGLHCPVMDGVELRIGWTERTIFIAKEATTLDCLYKEALEHQLRHVRLEDEALDAFLPGFTRELRTKIAEITSDPIPDMAQAKKDLVQSVDALTGNLMVPLEKERTWRREIVESDEELDRIRKACGGIDQRLREMGTSL